MKRTVSSFYLAIVMEGVSRFEMTLSLSSLFLRKDNEH